jgi:hypothetical protein
MEELCGGSAALLRFNASRILADALGKHTHAKSLSAGHSETDLSHLRLLPNAKILF